MSVLNFPISPGTTESTRVLKGVLKGTTIIESGSVVYHEAFQKLGGDPTLPLPYGFGPGNHPMYPLDGNGYVDVLPGPNHRSIYIGKPGESTTYTAAQLNAAESHVSSDTLSTVATYITTGQLSSGTDLPGGALWGGSPTYAIHQELAFNVLRNLLKDGTAPQRSIWIHYQAGGTYTDLQVNGNQFDSWSGYAQHPVKITRYGVGADPLIILTKSPDAFNFTSSPEHYWTLEGLDFTQTVDPAYPATRIGNVIFVSQASKGIIFNKIKTRKTVTIRTGCSYMTMMQCQMNESAFDRPANNTTWDVGGFDDRMQNGYNAVATGVLLWRNNLVQGGWRTGYNPGPNPTAASVQMPSQYSHVWYDNEGASDKSAIENILAYASSHGSKWGSGVYNVHNIYAENPIHYLIIANGVNNPNIPATPYSVCYQNLCQGSIKHQTFGGTGNLIFARAVSGGVDSGYPFSHENMFLHVINPNDPAEIAAKPANVVTAWSNTNSYAYAPNPYVPWTPKEFVGNWLDRPDQNINISDAALNALTLHRYYDSYMGNPQNTTNTAALMTAFKTIDVGAFLPGAIKHFITTLGGDAPLTDSVSTNLFVPEPKGDGFRWDGPYNWSQKRIPMDGDTVSISGETVTTWRNISNPIFDLGSDGTLIRYGGQHTITSGLNGTGTLRAYRTAKYVLDGCSIGTGNKTVELIDGAAMLVATDVSANISTVVSDFSALTLKGGFNYTVASGRSLTINGKNARVGFDGTGGATSTLTVASGGTLAFNANGDNNISTIAEWTSGLSGLNSATGRNNASSVVSQVVLSPGATITVNTAGLSSGATLTLIDVDSLTTTGWTIPANFTKVGNILRYTVP